MEDSMSSTNYKNKSVCSVSEIEFSSEDSSWSSYFVDSMASSSVADIAVCSGFDCFSLLSDSALSAEKIYANDDHAASAISISKRRKIRATFVDHDLEDTASSPVHNLEEKRTLSYQSGEVKHPEFIGKDKSYTELRKSGLCVVPLSMLFNF